jgi:hypothetical protein
MRGGEVPGEVLGVWPSPSALPASPSPDGSGAPPPLPGVRVVVAGRQGRGGAVE